MSIHYGSELELPHVSRFDSGVYLCIASNGVQPSVSKVVRLYVDCECTLSVDLFYLVMELFFVEGDEQPDQPK